MTGQEFGTRRLADVRKAGAKDRKPSSIPKYIKIYGTTAPVELGIETQWMKLNPVSLSFKGDVPFEEWMRSGYQLAVITKGVMFWIGDWLNFGENRYGEKYSQALEMGLFEIETLRNVSWVCRKVPAAVRRFNLSFGHHTEVAPLDLEKQGEYLERAEREQLTVMELRRLIHKQEHKDWNKISNKSWLEWFIDYCEEKHLKEQTAAVLREHVKVAWMAGGRNMKARLEYLFRQIIHKKISIAEAMKKFEAMDVSGGPIRSEDVSKRKEKS